MLLNLVEFESLECFLKKKLLYASIKILVDVQTELALHNAKDGQKKSLRLNPLTNEFIGLTRFPIHTLPGIVVQSLQASSPQYKKSFQDYSQYNIIII